MSIQTFSQNRYAKWIGGVFIITSISISSLYYNNLQGSISNNLQNAPSCPIAPDLEVLGPSEDSAIPANKSLAGESIYCPNGTIAIGIEYKPLFNPKNNISKLDATDGVTLRCDTPDNILAQKSDNVITVDNPDFIGNSNTSVGVYCPLGKVVTRILSADVPRANQPDALDGVGITCSNLLQSGDTQNPIDLIPSDIRTNKPLMILSASTNEVISGIQYDAQLPKQDPDSTDSIRTIISSNTKANGFCAFTPYDLKPVSGSEVHVQSVYGNFRHGPGATLRWSFRPSYGQYAQYLPSSIVEITDVKGEVQQREVLQDSTKIFFEEGDYDQSIQWRVRPIFYYGTDNTRIYGEWSPMHTFIPITPACGNAFTEMDEQCDDGNMLDEDGCNASCFIEADYSCRQGNGNTAASTCRTYQELVYAAIDGGVDGNSDGALEPYEVAIARADLQDSETMQHPKYDFDNSGTVNERDLAIFSQYAPSY